MTKSVEAACAAIVTVLRSAGLRNVPDADRLPENANVFPFVTVYPGGGVWEFESSGTRRGLQSIVVEVHVSRKDLPTAISAAIGYADSVPNALMYALISGDATMAAALDTFATITVSPLQPLAWGDVPTIGYRFTLDNVKIREAISAP